jgi:hypothetical protein
LIPTFLYDISKILNKKRKEKKRKEKKRKEKKRKEKSSH